MKTSVPRPPRAERRSDRAAGFAAASAAHAVLFAALAGMLQWHTQPETFYAELWSPEDVTGERSGDAPMPNKVVPETPTESLEETKDEAPPPQESVQSVAQQMALQAAQRAAEEQRLADIALEKQRLEEEKLRRDLEEKKRLEEQKKLEDERRRAEEEKRLEEERRAEEARKAEEARRLEEERLAAEKKKQEEQRRAEEKRKKAEAARKAAQEKARKERQERIAREMREAELARILGATKTGPQAGSSTGTKGVTRQNLTGSRSAGYIAKVIACIKPHINYPVPANLRRGQTTAAFRVTLTPQGDQMSHQKIRSSSLPAYDQAVERALRMCDPFPLPDGQQGAPRTIEITFDPVEDRSDAP